MWGEGYITDVEYTAQFFRPLAPSHLRYVLAMKGVVASSDGPDFDYMELGAGQGLSSLVLAAANPGARFYANDFNPTHVQRARRVAAAAGLDNIAFLETSFADLEGAGLPQMDFIVLHGILSWISPENQQAIVRFVSRHLKPGGVLYVSYNITPGWAPVAPLRRLLHLYASGLQGPSDRRMAEAGRFAGELADAGAAFFKAHPVLARTMEAIQGNSTYFPHEYLNGHWHLLTHAEVADQLSSAKLRFVASADVHDLLERFVLPEPASQFLARFADHPLRETIRDFLRNNNFRRDIFVRGGIESQPEARQQQVGAIKVALVRPRADCDLKVRFPIGTVQLAAQPHAAILDALVDGPKTVAELAPERSRISETALRVAALVAVGHLAPCMAGQPVTSDCTAGRLNRVLLGSVADGYDDRIVASPVLGSGISVDAGIRRLLLDPGARQPPAEGDRQAQIEARVSAYRALFSSLGISADQ